MKTVKIETIITLFLALLVLLTGCRNSGSKPSDSGSKPSAIGSLHGSVPFGKKAYSPDGKMYAREVKPRGHGNIGIYDLTTGKRLRVIDVTQHPAGDNPNDLKGLAWSPDSKWLAVMYHHGGGGHISIVNVDTGEEIKNLSISGWPHYMEFSTDGTKIKAGGKILDIR